MTEQKKGRPLSDVAPGVTDGSPLSDVAPGVEEDLGLRDGPDRMPIPDEERGEGRIKS